MKKKLMFASLALALGIMLMPMVAMASNVVIHNNTGSTIVGFAISDSGRNAWQTGTLGAPASTTNMTTTSGTPLVAVGTVDIITTTPTSSGNAMITDYDTVTALAPAATTGTPTATGTPMATATRIMPGQSFSVNIPDSISRYDLRVMYDDNSRHEYMNLRNSDLPNVRLNPNEAVMF